MRGIYFTLDTQDKKHYISVMKNTSFLKPKEIKASMTVRVHPSVREEVEDIAKKNKISLAVAVEEGMKLLIEKVKNEKAKS